MNNPLTTKTQKPKKFNIIKTLRLLDYHVYDDLNIKEGSVSSSEQEARKDKAQFTIQMFGINEKGETFSIYINDFNPFFFVKVGDNWTNKQLYELLADIKKKIGKGSKYYDESIVEAKLVEYHKLYGFSGCKKDKFIQFTFKNTVVFNKVKNLWYEYDTENGRRPKNFYFPSVNGIKLELYESNIPQLLRYFHIQNISPSSWVSISIDKAFKPDIKTTTCVYEYICRASCIKPMVEKETRVPYKICSFDIEASSSHGDFPLPKKTYKRLAMNLVDVFIKQLSNQSLDTDRSKILIKQIIMAAFGESKFDDIDQVYPKTKPTKKNLELLIEQLLTSPIQTIKKEISEDKSRLMTIDSVFDKIKNEQSHTVIASEDDDEADEGDTETPKYSYHKNASKPVKINKTTTIIDVLLDNQYERDDQITIINESITYLNFPELEGDKTTFIGSTFMRYGEKEPYLNHCIVLGTCDNIEGVEIESVQTEKELLLKWTELIQQENPDIIIGYNIFGFDYEFMFRRAEENNCEYEFLELSRRIGELCATKLKSKTDHHEKLAIENTKMVIASGEYDLRYPKISGRLQIDLYAYVRRDFNLSSYKLDDVASQIICDDIKKIGHYVHPTFGEVTELYSKNLSGLHVGDFIHIEITGFTSDYYKDGKKFTILDIVYDKEVVEIKKEKEVKNIYNVIVISGYEYFDETKSIKWGMAKDDVTPQQIFELTDGSSSDRAIVAKYCIQDCNLVQHLMNKIDVITGYIEMARICSIPISFLVFRGQGIKLTSYVAKKCREKNTLMPDLEKSYSNEGYEGAIVLPPKCSMYMDNPVACVDYSSLYPSSMISQNYSHDSKVWTMEYDLQGKLLRQTGERDKDGRYIYDNIEGYSYIDLDFDLFEYRRNSDKPSAKAVKTKVGKKVCRWAQFPDNKKGIMPSILEELLKARSDTRKKIKTETDPFMQNILDKRQLGYKITANSLYGQCGSKTSSFFEKDVAASTTATGRMMIIYAKRIIEEVYGNREYNTETHGPVLTKAEYVYGDSVVGYTPIYVKTRYGFDICTIEDISEKYGHGKWVTCKEEGKQEKEFCELGIDTWTEKGWTRLDRVIRHKLASHKKIIRVITNHGIVDVTDDHSLLTAAGVEISPKNVQLGTELLHHAFPKDIYDSEYASILQAKVVGFKLGKEIKEAIKQINYNRKAKIGCIVPQELLNGDKSLYLTFFECFVKSFYDTSVEEMLHSEMIRIYHTNQLCISRIYFMASKMGWDTTIHTMDDYLYCLTIRKKIVNSINPGNTESESQAITYMYPIQYEGYVYDLTTDNHHFAAGIGQMIVHNTDSVFFTFNLQDPKTGEKIVGKKALEITIEIAQDAAHLCSQWLKPPMELSYEKTLMPFILLSKKRYVGMLYETDPNKGKLKYMGLSLKRRDSCDYLKDTYGGILNILMEEHNIQNAIEFLNNSLNHLIDGKVNMDKLMITKALRGYYKNPNQIAHKVLADRIGQRDPGNKPKPGDRMRFVHIVNDDKKALQGEKIETPEFIIERKIKIDYTFYITNQLLKPLSQLLGLALEQVWEYQGKSTAINKFKKEIKQLSKEYTDLDIFMKKKEKLCSEKIKELLFNNHLKKIYNSKNGIQELSCFFSKK